LREVVILLLPSARNSLLSPPHPKPLSINGWRGAGERKKSNPVSFAEKCTFLIYHCVEKCYTTKKAEIEISAFCFESTLLMAR